MLAVLGSFGITTLVHSWQIHKLFSLPKAEQNEQTYALPNGEKITLDEIVKRFKESQRVPFPTAVQIETVNKVPRAGRVHWSVDNFERLETVNFATNCLIDYDDSKQISAIHELPGLIESGNELASVTSESGHLRICISKATGKESIGSKNGSTGQRLDVWDLNQNTILNSIDVDSTKHGAVCLVSQLAGLSFSPSEKQLLYVAEKKVKSEGYFKDAKLFKDDEKKPTNDEKEKPEKGDEYEWKQEWGEQLVGLRHTCICILTLEPEYKLRIIELPDRTLGQPFWIDEQTIGFIGYQEAPKRLGLIFCRNRVSYLYKCKLAQNDQDEHTFELIRGQKDDLSLSDPQINQQKDRVVFFESPAGGAHLQAQRAMLWDLKSNEIATIFDEYEAIQPKVKSLFVLGTTGCLPNYWLLDGEHVVLSTIHHSRQLLLTLNVLSKTLKVVDLPGFEYVNVLNLKNDLLALACSSPDQAPVVLFGFVDMKRAKPVEFKQLRANQPTKNTKMQYRIVRQNEDKPLEQIETILTGPADTFDKATPVVVVPHGGPHTASLAAYNRTNAFFVRLGFKVAEINYRGSLGISKDYVNQLTGNVGDMDVADCVSAINNLIALKLIDKNSVSLFGGSHGGFLVCHLIGQHPEFGFASCVARNPVIDMSKMFTVSDIPDWCLIETFGHDVETYKRLNNRPEENNLVKQLNRIIDVGQPEILKAMFEKSPMKYVDRVKTPVLMELGREDQRVPHYQGLSFVNALKVRNVETKCHLYPDNHSINKPKSGDFLINVARWIIRHLGKAK